MPLYEDLPKIKIGIGTGDGKREWVWADDLGYGLAIIDNIPFHVSSVSLHSIVRYVADPDYLPDAEPRLCLFDSLIVSFNRTVLVEYASEEVASALQHSPRHRVGCDTPPESKAAWACLKRSVERFGWQIEGLTPGFASLAVPKSVPEARITDVLERSPVVVGYDL
jgi:hypothetical protein